MWTTLLLRCEENTGLVELLNLQESGQSPDESVKIENTQIHCTELFVTSHCVDTPNLDLHSTTMSEERGCGEGGGVCYSDGVRYTIAYWSRRRRHKVCLL